MGNVILVFVFVTKLSTLLCLPIVPVNFVSRILVVRFILVSVFQTSIYECPVQLQFWWCTLEVWFVKYLKMWWQTILFWKQQTILCHSCRDVCNLFPRELFCQSLFHGRGEVWHTSSRRLPVWRKYGFKFPWKSSCTGKKRSTAIWSMPCKNYFLGDVKRNLYFCHVL